jgi:hypothetical protein
MYLPDFPVPVKVTKSFRWINTKSPDLIKVFVQAVEFVDQSKHQDNHLLARIAQQPVSREKQVEHAQFFTPPDVALYTAIQLLNNYQKEKNYVVFDPSVGKGSLLIASATVLAIEYGIRGQKLINALHGSEICAETHELAIDNIFNAIKPWIEGISERQALSSLRKNICNSDFFDATIPLKSLVIANPPYKETKGTGNIWIRFAEKIINHSNTIAFGMIVPVSIASAARTHGIRQDITMQYGAITAFHHETRPRPLFKGVEQRITILHATKLEQSNTYSTTGFLTHSAKNRLSVWEADYVKLDYRECKEVFPKLALEDMHFYKKNIASKITLSDFADPTKQHCVWVRTTGRYRLQAQIDKPNEVTTKWKQVYLKEEGAKILVTIFNNGKALGWWKIWGDGRDLSVNQFLTKFGVDEWMKSNNYTETPTKQNARHVGAWQKLEKS